MPSCRCPLRPEPLRNPTQATPGATCRPVSGLSLHAVLGVFDFEPCIPDVTQPPLPLFLKTTSKKPANARRRGGRQAAEVGFGLQDFSKDLADAFSCERRVPGQHFIKKTTERPDIGAPVRLLSRSLLGRHIGCGSKKSGGSRFAHGRRVLEIHYGIVTDFRQPEIEHLDLFIRRDLKVCRLEIPVNDPLIVSIIEGFGNLLRERQRFRKRYRALRERCASVSPSTSSRTSSREAPDSTT